MPVSKEKWNTGRKWENLQLRILTFLKDNPDTGFSDEEIYHALGYKTSKDFWDILAKIANLLAINNALETLVKERIINAKIVKETIGEITYYMIA